MKRLLWWVIFIAIVVRLVIYLFFQKSYFLRPFNFDYFGQLYTQSQYVKGNLSEGGIGDDGLYAFAGYYYMFKGGDVSSVNFEHPPLGKYLIGLSILVFNNENAINIIYFVLLLFITYKMAILLFGDDLIAIISTAVLSADPLLNDHLIRSLLDLPFSLFFLSALYFFLKGMKKTKYFYLSFLLWGTAFSTKFFPFFLVIYFMQLAVVIIKRQKLYPYLIASFLVPVIYLVCHVSFFIYHPSVIEFLRHKKWMLDWWKGSPIIPGNILRNIFTGQYIDSTGRLIRDHLWSLFQPVIFFFSVTSVRKSFFGKEKTAGIVYIFCLIFIAYMLFFTNGIFKYIMPVYPLLVIFAIRNISLCYSIITPCRKRNLPKSKEKSSAAFLL